MTDGDRMFQLGIDSLTLGVAMWTVGVGSWLMLFVVYLGLGVIVWAMVEVVRGVRR